MTRLTVRFPVHSYAVDAFGTLALPALAGYLQEIAGQHATALGCGIEVLQARGLTWVLARQRVEVPTPVRLGDELEIETWPSGVERLLVSREFTVRRGGEQVARATTAWLVLDVAARRPVRPDAVLDPSLRPRLTSLAPLALRLAAPAPSAAERRFDVRYADIDLNRHVNNTSYVAWALECISPERWASSRPCAVEGHFLAEGRLGDAVVARVSGDGDVLAQAIVREGDGKELARLETRWTARAPGCSSS
jgi:medium-chain acyl-[acyl-carrier-protein] hydrolase